MKAMQMLSRSLPSNIPLHCNICPKKPDFSDVSHLLTHIASKGHLSTYYKIKVKASSEDSSRQLIEQYDTWYALWNIEDLMSDRLNLKDKRKARARTIADVPPAVLPQWQFRQPYGLFPGQLPYEHAVDPRLVPQTIKTETMSRNATPMTVPYVDPLAMHGMQYPYANPLNPWPTPFMYMPAKQDYDDDEVSSEPSLIPSLGTATTLRTAADSTSVGDGDCDVDEGHEVNKLKGIFWPGMDMFDAAPPEQRRKRNQKKDTSVVKQLEAMSQMIEATEHIFSPLGTHRKSRPISGLPDSDDSPLPGEETPPRPKKAKRAPRRKPLAERDANTSRKQATQSQKRGRPAKRALVGAQKPSNHGQDSPRRTVPPRRPKKNVPTHQDRTEAVFSQATEMNTLTSAFQPPAQYQRPDFRPSPASNVEPAYLQQQGYYAYPPQAYYAPSLDPRWDNFTHDSSNMMANPLFFAPEHGSMNFEEGEDDDDDDEQTISIPDSDE